MKFNTDSGWFAAASFMLLVAAAITLLFVHNKDSHSNNLGQISTSSSQRTSSDTDSNGCYTPASVRKHYGESHCVDYTVGYVYETSAGTKFLDEKKDYYDGFVGYIPYNSNANLDINALDGKSIVITGTIQEYNGYPEIVITDSSQVKVYN